MEKNDDKGVRSIFRDRNNGQTESKGSFIVEDKIIQLLKSLDRMIDLSRLFRKVRN